MVGADAKGEIVWGFIPMARWQMLMFPIKYMGDFAGFWYRRFMEEQMGIASESNGSMDLSKREKYGKKSTRRPTWGD